MRIVDRLADLQKDAQAGVHCKLPLLAIAVDGFPVDVLCDQERITARGNSAVEEAGNVVVVQRRQKLALRFEAAEKLAVGKITGHDFQGDGLFELAVGPLGEIDGAHSSASQ